MIPKDLSSEGHLDVKVKVTTVLGNYMQSLHDNPVAMRWTGGKALQPMGMTGPVVL